MKVNEIIEIIKAENPEVLGKMNERAAARVVGGALAVLRTRIAASEENVKVYGLGVFRIANVEREKDGGKVAVKKISFAPAKPVDAVKVAEKRASRAAGKDSAKSK